MGDALDEEKERRQQLAGVSAEGWAPAMLPACRHAAAAPAAPSSAPPPRPATSRAGPSPAPPTPHHSPQVRKEAREAVARERDQQIALMIAK